MFPSSCLELLPGFFFWCCCLLVWTPSEWGVQLVQEAQRDVWGLLHPGSFPDWAITNCTTAVKTEDGEQNQANFTTHSRESHKPIKTNKNLLVHWICSLKLVNSRKPGHIVHIPEVNYQASLYLISHLNRILWSHALQFLPFLTFHWGHTWTHRASEWLSQSAGSSSILMATCLPLVDLQDNSTKKNCLQFHKLHFKIMSLNNR